MAIATFCSRIFGLVREQVLAFMFGASSMTDAFYVAFRIPNLLRDLFAEGAFSAAFVPTFIEAKEQSRESARKLLWSLLIVLTATTLAISTLIIIFAPEIISVFAPGFVGDSEKFEVTVGLTRMMAPFLTFVSIAALFMGALNSLKVFFIPALAPAFFNVTMIICMIALPSVMSSYGYPTIYALGAGVFIGGLVQALIQVPLILKKGFGPTLPKGGVHPKTKKVVKLLGPGLIGFAATQVNLIVNTILATGTVVGAVSWLSFAFRLFQLPVGILSVSIGNANLVHFSNAWKANRRDEARELLKSSYLTSWMIILPAMVISILFAQEIVHLIFERGAFDETSTLMTSKALVWYACGLPFYGIYKILVPAFYTIDRQKIPVYCSILSIAFNIVFCISLVPIYGFEVLALGTTFSMLFNSSAQTWIMRKDLDMGITGFLNLRLFKIFLVTGVTAALTWLVKPYVPYYELNFYGKCGYLLFSFSIIFIVYGGLLFAVGERSVVLNSLKKIKKRFGK
ncbi:MAG: murein biosynthesis integral membrane protein MurJ [Bacteriovoracaceae bacterium]|nr:murein biosynthesis integral membrane protein MurJ [Bacteriovoracaceae bacterium]